MPAAESTDALILTSDILPTPTPHPDRCSTCDRALPEPDGSRHLCFFFLE
jgi:hypothetical protein